MKNINSNSQSFLKRLLLSLFLFVCISDLRSQDLQFARKITDSLASSYFRGRGYVDDGMRKAASFLEGKFRSFGLQPLSDSSYHQYFSYPVNTFPGKMELSINGKKLKPGADFLVMPESSGRKVSGKFIQTDSIRFLDKTNRVLVELADRLTWSVSTEMIDLCVLKVDRKALQEPPNRYKLDIENRFIKKFEASNVCAFVRGTERPDSFIFFSAHYDHLGAMGNKTYFPGANDNASGVSLLLNLARWYARNPSRYSIGFICFAGEEAGLIGSRYFTENSPVDLKKIRFLLNTDLAGTGEEGITVVNATEFPAEFKLMQDINSQYSLLAAVNPRGKAANSDHYFFSEQGVPAFFFYTLGGIKAYHDIYDRPETLPLNEHEDLFRLVTTFVNRLTLIKNQE
jgi:hypothetical protein